MVKKQDSSEYGFEYKRKISEMEQKVLEDQYLDVKEWIDLAVAGAISRCIGHCARRRHAELTASGAKSLPAQEMDLVKNAFADPKYKNRKQRDAAIRVKKR